MTDGDFVTTQTLKRARLSSAEAIGGFNPDKIDMVGNGFTKAQTSALWGGNAFSVTWKHPVGTALRMRGLPAHP